MKAVEREITKEEFKRLYIRYGQSKPGTGWTKEYWNHFYKHEAGVRYFFTEPNSPTDDVMWISDSPDTKRIFFISEDATESFFDFPGKD